ncbi:MAG: lactate utilization protein [Desulfobacterales bacterium]
MQDPISQFWTLRLEAVADALRKNNFDARIVNSADSLKQTVMDEIVPALHPAGVSWGGSKTFVQTGLYEAFKALSDLEILDTYADGLSDADKMNLRRKALLTDLFVTGTNAVTENGWLVNLDMIGNRVGALTFGPRNVIVLAGRNKIVPDLEYALDRIKTYAAPVNAIRLEKKTPCAKTAVCHDCNSPDRICNTWTITEKSFPKGRIIVLLINADLGF